jgi:parallel beta-helix repeat protein
MVKLWKRITNQKIWIFGSGTFLAFFTLLLTLSYLGINVETSGNIVCSDKCISYFNITLTNYSLCFGSTFKGLYFDKNISYEVYKADMRYRNDNPNRWKLYNFSADKCLEKGKKHEFMLIGYKSPSETIKWGIDLQGNDVDPYWYRSSSIVINPFISNPNRPKITIDRGIKITGNDWMARYSVHFRVGENIYNWDQIPSSIQKTPWLIQIDENIYKYGYDFSNISTNIKNNLQNVILHLEESEGLTLNDIKKEGNIFIIKNITYISHDDILINYTIPIINKTDIVIGSLTNNFVDNGDGTWNITFDPTITIDEDAISTFTLENVTAETGDSNFTHLSASTVVPYDSLVFYMPFDKDLENSFTAWTAYDWSQYNNDGTSGGNVTVNTSAEGCLYDNCIYATGTGNSYITISGNMNVFNFAGNATMMLWIYYPATDGGRTSLLHDNSTTIQSGSIPWKWQIYDDTNYIRVGFRNSTGIMSSADLQTPAGINNLTTGWHHVALVYNGTSQILYYDGAFDEQKVAEGPINPMTSMDWIIGSSSASYDYVGYLDEIMIFNTDLSASQVLDVYNNQSSKFGEKGTQSLIVDGCVNITTGLTCAAIYDETACGEQTGECLWVTGECVNNGANPKCTNFQSNQTCENYDSTQPENTKCNWRFGIDTAKNRVNVTTLFENNFESSVNLSIGYQNTTGWFYTEPQTLTSNTNHIFNISSASNSLSLNYTQIAGNSTDFFYSPIMYGDMNLDIWSEEEEEEGITSCQNFVNEGIYIQTANIIPDTGEQCIALLGENITYDCNGFSIYNTTYNNIGILGNQNNLTIKNCNITIGSSYGISLSAGSSSLIVDNILLGNSYGVYLISSSNNQVINNTLRGFRFSTSDNNIALNNKINGGSSGIFMASSGNNTFQDGNFSGNTNYDVYLTDSNSTFLNISYDIELVETSSSLIRKWYYKAYVNDTTGNNLGEVNITAFNITNDYEFNLTTDSTGYTELGEIIDYVNNDETRTYYSPYNITAFNSSYNLDSHTYNATLEESNYKDVFTLTLLEEGADVDYSVVLPLNVIRFINCSPDWEFYPSYPIGQDSDIGCINATNNGTAIGDFTIKLTSNPADRWTIFGCNVTTFSLSNCLTLTTSYQNIWFGVAVSEVKKIWLYANCSYVTSNPQTSIDMGVS